MSKRKHKPISLKIYKIDEKLNYSIHIGVIATACENQCVHTNVNSKKLGRTRS